MKKARRRACCAVQITSRDAVDGVATCDQHNKRGDTSVRLVGTTNPLQIEVMEFALIVEKNGDYSRQCGRDLSVMRPSYRLVVYVADLLWTCSGEAGVIDFGLICADHNSPLTTVTLSCTVFYTVTQKAQRVVYSCALRCVASDSQR